jgi:hypothetical protein
MRLFSKEIGKKNFFNLGFKNKWQKILPLNIRDQINIKLKEDLKKLGYEIDQ